MSQNAAAPVISMKAMGFAFLGAALLYAGLGGYVLMQGPAFLDRFQQQLPSEVIDYPAALYEQSEPKYQTSQPQSVTDDQEAPDHGSEHVSEQDTSVSSDQHVDAVIGDKKALLPSPFNGLTEKSAFGLLPIIGKNNLTPFKAYKKPYTRNPKKSAIALVVKNYGMQDLLSKDAGALLPTNVTFLMSPYVERADFYQKAARASGHEIWLNLPMERGTFPADDPGSHGLLSHSGLKYNNDNLQWILSRTTGYAGVAAFTDSSFDDAKSMLQGLFQSFLSRGLGYLELNPLATTFSRNIAATEDAPFVKNNLSEDMQFRELKKSFEALKLSASHNGHAVGVLNLSPVLLQDLSKFVQQMEAEGFEIVPLSAIADQ